MLNILQKLIDLFKKNHYNASIKITYIHKESNMAFEPLKDRLLVLREEQSNQTASGLYIPDTAKEKPLEGKVVAVGPDAKNDGINIDDTVVFANFSGMEITIEGTEYLILLSKEVLGLIK
jgi:chaperonin GroES